MADEAVIWCEDCQSFESDGMCGEGTCTVNPETDAWYGKDASKCEWFKPKQKCDTCRHGCHWDSIVICDRDGQRHKRTDSCEDGEYAADCH